MSLQPFPGLRPFNLDETDVFFGREDSLDIMVERLGRNRFLAVTGSSGSGKSSLVFTGLIDALDRGLLAGAGADWSTVIFRPGARPLQELARALSEPGAQRLCSLAEPLLRAALASSPNALADQLSALTFGRNVLIVVDQFEEIFRYRSGEDRPSDQASEESLAWRDETQSFVTLLLESAKQRSIPIYVVITVRSDFLGECAEFNGLAEAINASQFLTPRLTRAELTRCIEGPVRVYGGTIEPILVNRLLNEMGSSSDQLPLMQHAMMRLWEMTPGEPKNLTLARYEGELRSLHHALSDHLDEIERELKSEQKPLVETLFRAITEGSGSKNDRRRPTTLSTIAAIAERPPDHLISVIDAFRGPGKNFLLPRKELTPESTIDISHETIIRQWEVLQENWIRNEFASAELYRKLEYSALRWKDRHGAQLHGADLSEALLWREREHPNAAWASRYGSHFELVADFIARSRMRRRAWYVFDGAVALAVIALVAAVSIYFFVTRTTWLADGKKEADLALSELQARNSDAALSDSIQSLDDFRKAGSGKIGQGSSAYMAASTLFAAGSSLSQLLQLHHGSLVDFAAYSQDGRYVATASSDYTVAIWDALSGAQISQFKPNVDHNQKDGVDDVVDGIKFDPTSSDRILAVSYNGRAYFWNWRKARLIKLIDLSPDMKGPNNPNYRLTNVSISGDGKYAVVASSDGTARVFDLTAPARIVTKYNALLELRGHRRSVQYADFSPDGTRIVTASQDGTARVWDAKTGLQEAVLHHDGTVNSAMFSPKSDEIVLTASSDRTARLWDVSGGSNAAIQMHVFAGHNLGVTFASFSRDGDHIVTSSADATARVWDANSGVELKVLSGHDLTVSSAMFSPDEDHVVTASNDRTARIWDVRDVADNTFYALENSINSVRVSGQGDLAVIASDDGTAVVRSLRQFDQAGPDKGFICEPPIVQPSPENPDPPHGSINSAVFSHDGKMIATASDDNRVNVWPRGYHGCTPVRTLLGHIGPVYFVDFSPDDSRLVSASADGTARVWDAKTGNPVLTLKTKHGWVYTAAYSHDPAGRYIVTGEFGKSATVWDAHRGMPVRSLPHQDRVRSAEFSPDNSRVLTAEYGSSRKPVARVWDWRTGNEVFHIPLDPKSGFLYRATYSHNGRVIATASTDGIIRIWDARSGTPVGAAYGPNAHANFVAFSPDDHTIAVGFNDRSARLWKFAAPELDMSVDEELAWARAASFGGDFSVSSLTNSPLLPHSDLDLANQIYELCNRTDLNSRIACASTRANEHSTNLDLALFWKYAQAARSSPQLSLESQVQMLARKLAVEGRRADAARLLTH